MTSVTRPNPKALRADTISELFKASIFPFNFVYDEICLAFSASWYHHMKPTIRITAEFAEITGRWTAGVSHHVVAIC